MEERAILILCFEFKFSCSLKTFAFFLDFWAKQSTLQYALNYEKDIIRLYVSAADEELGKFSDEYLSLVPHSIFLQSSKVKVAEYLPAHQEQIFDFKFKNITPKSLKNGKNEFGFGFDDEFINEAVKRIENGESIIYEGALISKFDSFDADYLLPTNLNTLPKIFVVDEKSLIALASFEKPVLSLKTNAIFRTNHKNTPTFFDVRAAWDINIYKIASILNAKGINFLKVKSSQNEFKINVLDDSFLIVRNSEFLQREDLDFIGSKSDKNLATFGLMLKEFDLLDTTVARIFFSHKFDDFIKVYKGNDEFDMFKLSIPKSYEEIYEQIATFNGGDRLLENYKKSFLLPSGKFSLPNNFYSIYSILDEILGFNGKLFDFARDFGGSKGVRIDYKMKSKNEFDVITLIRSAMSFKLAGAEPKNISFGCFESLAFFVSDFGDIIKDEFECQNFLLSGELFESKTIANLVLKYSNSNYKTRFSEQYPLEIS